MCEEESLLAERFDMHSQHLNGGCLFLVVVTFWTLHAQFTLV